MNPFTFRVSLIALLVFPASAALGQGLLLHPDPDHHPRLPRPIEPRRPHFPPVRPAMSYRVKDLSIQATLTDQIAKVQMSQTFANTGSQQLEAAFVFPLPYDGAIDRMTLMLDGREYPAELLDADKARQLYENIVRRSQDPALLEWLGTGLFRTSVFPIPAGATRTVTIRYSQLCRKEQGLTDLILPLAAAKYTAEAPERVAIHLSIESATPIKNVYSPTHSIDIQRPDDRHASVRYEIANQVPTSDFRLLYSSETGPLGASALSYRPSAGEDGFFLLLATPEIKSAEATPLAKTVLIVLDRSGSMSGEKIEQARGALKFVVNNLREGDLFNVIAYDSEVTSFRPELQRFTPETRAAAIGFVEGIFAGGSTNIDGALRTAMSQLQDSGRPNYVIFLTDGLPTAGETHEGRIVENAKLLNKVRARVFNFGVGYDVNARLLDRLARANFGLSEYVRPSENIEAQVSRLYNRIGAPVMTDVSVSFEFDAHRTEEGPPINRVYPSEAFDLFAGEQLAVVGRFRKSGPAKVRISGRVGGEQKTFDFPATLAGQSSDESFGFVEKLWALRRIGEIIDEIDLRGQNEELVNELVALSTKHGVLTPYTSFLADDQVDIHRVAGNREQARQRLTQLGYLSGESGFAQRRAKSDLLRPAASSPARGGRVAFLDVDDKLKEVQSVLNVGNRTFFCKGGNWIDSTITEEQKKNAVKLVQFSDEYFALASKHGRAMSQYMAFDEPVILNLEGKAYCIEPPASEPRP